MSEKIVVLIGSPRAAGNTEILAGAFADSAREAGKSVDVIRVTDYRIAPCTGCNFCFTNQAHSCAQSDDIAEIYGRLAVADTLVIATPIYFFSMSAQLKCLIDRLHNPIRDGFKVKKLALLAVGASQREFAFDAILSVYKCAISYFKLTDGGVITVGGVKNDGDILGNTALDTARELGKTI